MLIDTHAHLQDDVLIKNINNVLSGAKESGVKYIIVPSYDIVSSKQAVALAGEYNNLFATVGIHPHDAKSYNSQAEGELLNFCKHKKVVAVGEIGLDYHYNLSPKEEQQQAFISQIKLANKVNLPIVIHMREATMDTLNIVKQNLHLIKAGVFHCFSGSVETLKQIINWGFYVSYGGAVTFNNANSLREVVKNTPLDRILLETDCPYMTPVPLRGKINEPKNITLIAQEICKIKNITMKQLEDITTANAKNLFKLDFV